MKLPYKENFRFLSVGKWEERKGWPVLLKAYISEFDHSDDVTLLIRSTLDDKNQKQYETILESIATELGKDKKDFPSIHFLKDQLPYSKLPSLYKAVDAFVIATHGEGWGLPIVESMAMKLPVIATNWSGSTEFLTEQNSYPLPIESLVKSTTPGHNWAQPLHLALKTLMRYVYENRAESIETGKVAREDIVNHYSYDKIAEIVIEKINDLIKNKEEILRHRETKKKNASERKPQGNESKHNKIAIKIVET